MKRKTALLLGMVLMVSGLMTGCGGSGDGTMKEEITEDMQDMEQDVEDMLPGDETTDDQTTDDQTNRNLKMGLAVGTDISGSKAAAEEDGLAETNVTVAAVTVDDEGKIVSCKIDEVQIGLNFDKEGKLLTDLETDFRTKQELGSDYGMENASSIGKEWNEQVNAFADYCVGKTADEVEKIAVTEAGKAKDADLLASCTIAIKDFREIVAKAAKNAE